MNTISCLDLFPRNAPGQKFLSMSELESITTYKTLDTLKFNIVSNCFNKRVQKQLWSNFVGSADG